MTELAYPSGLPSGQGFVRLREIRDCLQPREVLRWRDLAIVGLCFDSKEARSGNLFFAIPAAISEGATLKPAPGMIMMFARRARSSKVKALDVSSTSPARST